MYRQTSLLRMLLDQHVERVLVVETEGEILRDGDVDGVSQLLAATGDTSSKKFGRRVAADPDVVESLLNQVGQVFQRLRADGSTGGVLIASAVARGHADRCRPDSAPRQRDKRPATAAASRVPAPRQYQRSEYDRHARCGASGCIV